METGFDQTYEQLMALIRQGDQLAFQEFYFRTSVKVKNFCIKFSKSADEAEDLTQNIYIQLWENREKIDPSKNPETLLYVMARYNTLDMWKRKLRFQNYVQLQSKTESFENATDQMISYKDSETIISLSIEKLPPQAQSVYRLSREKGYTHQEITDMLHISTNTVSNHIKKSVKFIRKYYNSMHAEYSSCIILFFIGCL